MERLEKFSSSYIILIVALSVLPSLVEAAEKTKNGIVRFEVSQKFDPESGEARRTPEEALAERAADEMVEILAGSFMMGSPPGEGQDDEHPQHEVYVDAFYIDKYEVTNAQYKAFLDATAYKGKSDADRDYLMSWRRGTYPSGEGNHPVIWVSWKNATAYAKWAKKRLPTEAEWEKACRAGSTYKYSFGNSASQLGEYAWYGSNSGPKTHPVGQKKPNAWDLYDMHGNVWEWCSDWYAKSYYGKRESRNPDNQTSGRTARVVRGGSWEDDNPDYMRSAYRNDYKPVYSFYNLGFRCAQDF